MPQFTRYIGVDYSGAQTSVSSLKGLRVYQADSGNGANRQAQEVLPPLGSRKYWTRRGVALWLAEQLAVDMPTIVGIDHGFSFPLRYFQAHDLPLNWDAFLDDFVNHWPTNEDQVSVELVRNGVVGDGANRMGDARWRRECEIRSRAKSVFHFDVQGSVAKSTHTGIAWLHYLRKQLGERLHCWPFDGWQIPVGRSAVLEAYPAIYKRDFATEDRTPDQHDAFSIAMWLRDADADGRLQGALKPDLSVSLLEQAQVEGWILGVESA